MKIHEFIWPEDRVDHIAQHGVGLKKLRRFVSGVRWFNAQSPLGQIQSIMYWDKQRLDAICFVL